MMWMTRLFTGRRLKKDFHSLPPSLSALPEERTSGKQPALSRVLTMFIF